MRRIHGVLRAIVAILVCAAMALMGGPAIARAEPGIIPPVLVKHTRFTPQAPTVTPVCGDDNDRLEASTDPRVTFSIAWVSNHGTVTATLTEEAVAAGWDLTQNTWLFVDSGVCPLDLPPVSAYEVCAEPDEAPNNDGYLLPGPMPAHMSLEINRATLGGAYDVVATADEGYALRAPAGGLVATFSWHFVDSLSICGASTDVTLVWPATEPRCGDNNDTLAAFSPGLVSYALAWAEGTNDRNEGTITASLTQAGIDGHYTLPAVHTMQVYDEGLCVLETPRRPTQRGICGAGLNNDDFINPGVAHLSYRIERSETDGTYTVTATPAENYRFSGAPPWAVTWDYTDLLIPCSMTEARPQWPTQTARCGAVNDLFSDVQDTDAVDYEWGPWTPVLIDNLPTDKSSRTLSAIAKRGYFFWYDDGDGQRTKVSEVSMTYVDDNTECVATALPPIVTERCGAADLIQFPSIDGVRYFMDEAWTDGKRDVWAMPLDGYQLTNEGASWTVVDKLTACDAPYVSVGSIQQTVATLDPTRTPVCGVNNDTITLPAVFGVTYSQGQGWSSGKAVVTATATTADVVLSGLTRWELVDDPAAGCPQIPGEQVPTVPQEPVVPVVPAQPVAVPVVAPAAPVIEQADVAALPYTGTDTVLTSLTMALLLGAGGGLLLLLSRRPRTRRR